MEFGIFDHVDTSGVSLQDHYDNRLKIVEAYDRARLLDLSRRRAPRDAARPCRLARRLSRRGRATHEEAPLRPAGLHAAALPSAAAHRRNLHARPDERRPPRCRHRPRHLAVGNQGLRHRSHRARRPLRGDAPGDDAGADAEYRSTSRASTSPSRTCRWSLRRFRSRIRRSGSGRRPPTAPRAPRATATTSSRSRRAAETRVLTDRYRAAWKEAHGEEPLPKLGLGRFIVVAEDRRGGACTRRAAPTGAGTTASTTCGASTAWCRPPASARANSTRSCMAGAASPARPRPSSTR